MHVTHLSLANFRNYARAELALAAGPTLLVGRNGQGKTNLVEAISYPSLGGSHRVAGDAALVRAGEDAAIVRMRVAHDDRAIVVELQLNKSGTNRAQVNGSVVRMRELPRYVHTVLFAPEDLALVRGEPSGRRAFLDALVVQRSPRMAGTIGDYERVLRQRNSLLKSARASRLSADTLTTLDVWDERLVTLGVEIMAARMALVAELRPHLAAGYSAVAGDDHAATMGMRHSAADPGGDAPLDDRDELDTDRAAEQFRFSLAERRRAELERAITLVGPHRDDLVLTLNDLPARTHASHGESWSYALALKLAAARVLRADAVAGDPIVILDDVFAELDEGRRERLADAVADFEQVLITAAVENDVPERLAATRIPIVAGTIPVTDEGGDA
ncbi:DNA replication/repair protein RecF [Microcella sp.]|uniref:DNA replication/repair protein RecF n=1 Tax=Microcella sp. TaxID=1913979 RepID=UPI003918E2B5